MKTAYGIVEKLTDADMRKDCEQVFWLLSTDEGMKLCRELFRQLGSQVASGKDLAKQLITAEQGMGFGKSVWIRAERILQPSQFLNLVADKRVLIDEGAGSQHGMNTHRMQWWLVYTAWTKGRLKLEHPPGVLYVKVGQTKITNLRVLWDDLFDNLDNAYLELGRAKDTFAHPEYLCKWLKGRGSKKSKDKDNDNNNNHNTADAKTPMYQRLSKAFAELEKDLQPDEICTGELTTV